MRSSDGRVEQSAASVDEKRSNGREIIGRVMLVRVGDLREFLRVTVWRLGYDGRKCERGTLLAVMILCEE